MAQVYTDDTDASWTFTVTSRDATTNVDWTSPMVAIDSGPYNVAATWEGDPAPSRRIKVPLAGLPVGTKRLFLQNPTGADFFLGHVVVSVR